MARRSRFYVACPDCSSDEGSDAVSTTWPSESHATIRSQVHNSENHGGEEVAVVADHAALAEHPEDAAERAAREAAHPEEAHGDGE